MWTIFPIDSVTIRVRGSFVYPPSFIDRIRARALLIHLDEPFISGVHKLIHTMRTGCLFPRHLFCDLIHVTLRLFRSGAWTFPVCNTLDDLLYEIEHLCPNVKSFTLDGCGSNRNRKAVPFPKQDAVVIDYIGTRAFELEFCNQGLWHA